jgi:hypothetical protein
MCIQVNDDKLPITKSSHSRENFVYYIHKNKVDIQPYKLQDPLHNIKLKFSKLRFFMVDMVYGDSIKYIRHYSYHPTELSTFQYLGVGDSLLRLSEKNIRFGYDNYSGTTKLDNVYFEKNTHAYLQFHGPSIGSFQSVEMNEPPKQNGLICGYLSTETNSVPNLKSSTGSGNGGYVCMSQWFQCSRQLYILYLLLTVGKSHEIFHQKNKNQILDMLETNRSLKIVGSTQSKMENYEHLDVEPNSVRYCDIYKAIAEIFYFQSDVPIAMRKIPETFRIPTCPEFYTQALLYAFG